MKKIYLPFLFLFFSCNMLNNSYHQQAYSYDDNYIKVLKTYDNKWKDILIKDTNVILIYGDNNLLGFMGGSVASKFLPLSMDTKETEYYFFLDKSSYGIYKDSTLIESYKYHTYDSVYFDTFDDIKIKTTDTIKNIDLHITHRKNIIDIILVESSNNLKKNVVYKKEALIINDLIIFDVNR